MILMKTDGSCRVLVRGGTGKKNGCSTLYVKDISEALQKKVEFFRKDDITFQPDHENALSKSVFPAMRTDYIRTYFEDGKMKEMVSYGSGDV